MTDLNTTQTQQKEDGTPLTDLEAMTVAVSQLLEQFEEIAAITNDNKFVVVTPDVVSDGQGLGSDIYCEDFEGFSITFWESRVEANSGNALGGWPIEDAHFSGGCNYQDIAKQLIEANVIVWNLEGVTEKVTPDVEGAYGTMAIGGYGIGVVMFGEELEGHFGADLVVKSIDGIVYQEHTSYQRVIDALEAGIEIVEAHKTGGDDAVMAWQYEDVNPKY